MNVLVYSGRGVSAESLHHTVKSLRNSVGGNYDIKLVGAETLGQEPWEDACQLLVLPGGRDLPMVSDLQGRPIERIRRYVLEQEGRLLGICAGAYFSCAKVDFERGTPIAVIGPRELSLCQATATGAIYPGFEYNSNAGVHAVPISISPGGPPTNGTKFYYNGGCWFDFRSSSPSIPAPLTFHISGTYTEKNNVPAIIIGTKAGEQTPLVILTGLHVEIDAEEMAVQRPDLPILPVLLEHDKGRLKTWEWMLCSLGLTLSPKDGPQLSPTPLYMSFADEKGQSAFIKLLQKNVHYKDGFLACEALRVSFLEGEGDDSMLEGSYKIIVNSKMDKKPDWTFSPALFHQYLKEKTPSMDAVIGKQLLYAEYINSTQTILTHNPTLASLLPNGTIVLAGDQLAGKGRGKNSWLSSKGCLQFTMLLHHQAASTLTLIQYLIVLSMAEAILSEPGYQDLPIRIKWPNDLYSVVDGELKKMGGVLVNSQTLDEGFLLMIGFGTNIYDTPWTRSLNDLIQSHNPALAPWTKELLLARFCAKFHQLYQEMLTCGFPFEAYQKRWLHSGQVVFIEADQLRARIEGIDQNGYLVARPHTDGLLGLLGTANNVTQLSSQPILLQPDGNSFDMMKNLITRK